jgi:hypothetical protein
MLFDNPRHLTRLDAPKILSAVYSPHDMPQVYERMVTAPGDFPVGAVFD